LKNGRRNTIIHILNVDEFRFLYIKLLSKISAGSLKVIKHIFYPYPYVKTTPSCIAHIRGNILRSDFLDGITLSSELVNSYLKMIDVKNSKIHFINIPVDEEFFFPSELVRHQARLRINIPIDKKVVLYIGQIEPVRGAFELLRAFKMIVQDFPAKLVFATPCSEYEKKFWTKFNKLIKELNIQDHLIIIGRVENINELYNIADVVVLPFQGPYKITDPPLTVLEALSCAKPLITTPYGTIKFIVKNQINGFISSPAAEEIASTVSEVFNMDEEDLSKIKQRARETILTKFSLKVVGRQLVRLYSLYR
jgi:glycosyltransferase involved in cell wall biosynthesis